MLVSSMHKQSQLYSKHSNIPFHEYCIEVVTCKKLLGVYINSTLSWDEHINNLIKKITSMYIYCHASNATCLFQAGNSFIMHISCHILITDVLFGVTAVPILKINLQNSKNKLPDYFWTEILVPLLHSFSLNKN